MDKKVEIPMEKVGANLPNSVKEIMDKAIRGEQVSSGELQEALEMGGKSALTYLNEQLDISKELMPQEDSTDKDKKVKLLERIKRNNSEYETKCKGGKER